MGYGEIFRREIVRMSVADDFSTAMMEWDVTSYYAGRKETNCICTHPIVHICLAENPLTKLSAVIGNCCIEKFGTLEQAEEVVRLRKEVDNKTRPCGLCLRAYHKENAKSKLVCNTCWDNNIQCQTCQSWFHCHDVTERNWKKDCTPCWQRARGRSVTSSCEARIGKRKTRDCQNPCCSSRISWDEPSWKQYCLKCFKKGHARQERARRLELF